VLLKLLKRNNISLIDLSKLPISEIKEHLRNLCRVKKRKRIIEGKEDKPIDRTIADRVYCIYEFKK